MRDYLRYSVAAKNFEVELAYASEQNLKQYKNLYSRYSTNKMLIYATKIGFLPLLGRLGGKTDSFEIIFVGVE